MNATSPATGRLVMTGLDGHGLTPTLARMLEAGEIGGLILFRDDLSSLFEVSRLIAEARAIAPHPILVAIDEEGGLITQIDGVPVTPGSSLVARGGPAPGALGDHDDPELTRSVFEAVGRVLRATGVDLALAPLSDVNVRADNPVIGRRSFGAETHRVILHGVAARQGLHQAGVLSCAKHFPGHGAAALDSHVDFPTIEGPPPELAAFAAAIADGVPVVMTAHVRYPALDPSGEPATRSSAILDRLLRRDLGFEGVVVSDALEMKGFAGGEEDGEREAEAFRTALMAGVDLLLVARGADRAQRVVRALAGAASSPGPERARIEQARGRLDRLIAMIGSAGAGASTLPSVVEASAAIVSAAHRDAMGPVRAPDVDPRERCALLVPGHVPEAYHIGCGDGFREALPATRVVSFSPDRDLESDLPDEIAMLLPVLLVRGKDPSEEDRRMMAWADRWGRGGSGRSVVALAAADHGVLDTIPAGWGGLGLTGSHRSAFSAAGQVVAGWISTAGAP